MNRSYIQKIERVPQELKESKSWLGWKWTKRPGETKPTKVPHLWHTPTSRASTTDPKTWGTYEQVVWAYKDSQGKGYQLDGLGIVLTDCVGIDLDNAVSNGVSSLTADDIIDELPCYWELSPSKKGLKGFFLADLQPILDGHPDLDTVPKRVTVENVGVEIYGPWSPRFFTVTGDHWCGPTESLVNCQAGFERVFEGIFADRLKAAQKAAHVAGTSALDKLQVDDQTVLKLAFGSAIGATIKALFEGRLDQTKHPSNSEARLALLGYLAFWAGPRPDMLDRLFRASALYSDDPKKWDRVGKKEIDLVLSGEREVYNWNHYHRRVERDRLAEAIQESMKEWSTDAKVRQ